MQKYSLINYPYFDLGSLAYKLSYKPPQLNADRFKLNLDSQITDYKPDTDKKISTQALLEAATAGVSKVLSSILGKSTTIPTAPAPALGGNPVPFIPTQTMYPLRQEFRPMLGRILGR